ncbi:MAG: glycine cleavage system protein H [Planctomycetes bacterium]|nr:glycine cleavage system protein H [Planctomycetota bacterium]
MIAFKLCDRDFECERCPLDLALGVARAPRAPDPTKAPGRVELAKLEFPDDREYSPRHVWVAPLDAVRVRCGLDALAARFIGRLHAFVLPAAGTHVRAGEPLGWIVDEDEASPVAAPVDGLVLAANPRVRAEPALALGDPYHSGWLVELARDGRGGDGGSRLALHDAHEARRLAARDLRAWRRLVARRVDRAHGSERVPGVGRTAQDGGSPLRDLRRVLGASRFRRLLRRWLG